MCKKNKGIKAGLQVNQVLGSKAEDQKVEQRDGV